MKALLIRGLKFIVRLIIAGIIIGIVAGIIAGIIYGGTYVFSYLTGRYIADEYNFLQQYYEAGFYIALVALSDEVKKYWR